MKNNITLSEEQIEQVVSIYIGNMIRQLDEEILFQSRLDPYTCNDVMNQVWHEGTQLVHRFKYAGNPNIPNSTLSDIIDFVLNNKSIEDTHHR